MSAALIIYHLLIAFFLGFCLGAACFYRPEAKQQDKAPELNKLALEMEWRWAKSLLAYTPLLLTGCVVYYAFISNGASEPMRSIRPMVGLVAITAIVNMLFSSLLFLSEYFSFTYPVQHPCFLHRFLYRINRAIAQFWHMIPLTSLCIQAYLVGYIFIKLAFT